MKTLKRSIRLCILLTTVLLTISQQSLAETIDLTNKDGQTITARLVRYDGKKVDVFRLSDSKTFSIDINTLDDKTRNLIELWVKNGGNLVEDYKVSVKTGKTNKQISGFRYYSSSSKRVNLEPDFTVKNQHTSMETRPVQLTILFLGRPVANRSNHYVFRTQTFDIPKLAPLTSKDFKVNPVSEPYYQYRSGGGYGAKYLGYVWIIHNKLKTKIITSNSVPTSLKEKALLNFLEMKSRTEYDENLLPLQVRRFLD